MGIPKTKNRGTYSETSFDKMYLEKVKAANVYTRIYTFLQLHTIPLLLRRSLVMNMTCLCDNLLFTVLSTHLQGLGYALYMLSKHIYPSSLLDPYSER